MSGNIYGSVLRLSTFGESHGVALGGVLDGVPSGISLDVDKIQEQLDRRRPGQSDIVTPRKESDRVKILSGVFEGITTGTPIGFIIENENQHSADYSDMKDKFRPSHADYTYLQKYGIRDHRGGGRSSARETACRIVGGALAMQIIPDIKITAYVSSVGGISLWEDYSKYDLSTIDLNPIRCPDTSKAAQMESLIREVRASGDTIGGTICCVIQNTPIGLGEPVFDRLEAELAKACMSIPACKGFEVGSGFAGTVMRGSEHNDPFTEGGKTTSNRSGGIQGGISNGMDIVIRTAFKPVATIMTEQQTIDIHGSATTIKAHGRHDACVLPRAVPVVEAMVAMTVADFYLRNRTNRI